MWLSKYQSFFYGFDPRGGIAHKFISIQTLLTLLVLLTFQEYRTFPSLIERQMTSDSYSYCTLTKSNLRRTQVEQLRIWISRVSYPKSSLRVVSA